MWGDLVKVKNILVIPILILFFIGYASESQNVSFGFYSADTNPASYQPNWTSLTHVSYLAWIANADGTISDRSQNTNSYANTIFQDAHQHGVKTVIGIETGNQSVMDNILANHANDFANNISSKIKATGAEGVILDFEYPQNTNSITGASNTVLYENMMKIVYNKVKVMNPYYFVAFCTPPYFDEDKAVYKNSNLSNHIDAVFIMCYDYNYPQTHTRANSPFYNDSVRPGIRHTVEQQGRIFGKDKLILGLPLYGYEYIAASNQPEASVLSFVDYAYLKYIDKEVKTYGKQWDSDSNTPWYYYSNESIGTNTQKVLNNCDILGSTIYDYHVARTLETTNKIEGIGAFKCVAISNDDTYMLFRNNSKWNISSATYVCAYVQAPAGKSMAIYLFTGEDKDYVGYNWIANGNWQRIVVPFKELTPNGDFNSSSVYDIRIDETNAQAGDIYYVDKITTDTYVDTYHQVWYDDNESLALKYQYMKDQGLQGAGFWALGHEGNNSSIWDVFARQSDNKLPQSSVSNFKANNYLVLYYKLVNLF
jgi:spore germination protein YaaH